MKNPLISIFFFCACSLAFSVTASGQNQSAANKDNGSSIAASLLKGTGKAGVIVVRSAGKAAWATTKFTAKHAVKPIFVEAAPKAGLFLLKQSGALAKDVLPMILKLGS